MKKVLLTLNIIINFENLLKNEKSSLFSDWLHFIIKTIKNNCIIITYKIELISVPQICICCFSGRLNVVCNRLY